MPDDSPVSDEVQTPAEQPAQSEPEPEWPEPEWPDVTLTETRDASSVLRIFRTK